MDDESWSITLSTAIGGILGWLSAKMKVIELCEITDDYWGTTTTYDQCRDESWDWNAEANLMAFTDLVYPSRILTGLVFGLLFGVIYVKYKRVQSGDASEEE
ncbi:MAG: hypothetical protein CXT66_02775 [Methanobacteriota archaeon]|jgi:hypothetical protein|nr:MAG: hypothetical protein CXT66_02775 [Euryarchaeota archaeon]